jgi:Methyltransferase domain
MGILRIAARARDVIHSGVGAADIHLLKAELLAEHRGWDRRAMADMLPKGGVGAEIGVFAGMFSAILLDKTKPKIAYFVDPWWTLFGDRYPDWGSYYTDYGKLATRTAYKSACRRIGWHAEKGAKTEIVVDLSTNFFKRMPDHHFDWIYLDSSHSYEGTVAELAVIRSKLKPDGILAGDDWFDDPSNANHGVSKAVRESLSRSEYRSLELLPAHQWLVRP